jgi:hypothetical protein
MQITIEQISKDELKKEVYSFFIDEHLILRCLNVYLCERRTKRCKFKYPVRCGGKEPTQDIINLALENAKNSIKYVD